MDFVNIRGRLSRWLVPVALLALAMPAAGLGLYANSTQVGAETPEPIVGPSGIRDGDGPVFAPFDAGETAGPGDLQLGGINEPTIAINPLDANNIVAASLFRLHVSTDGGATFSGPTFLVVPTGFSPAGDPSLAFDSQGRLFWTYLGRNSSNDPLASAAPAFICLPLPGSVRNNRTDGWASAPAQVPSRLPPSTTITSASTCRASASIDARQDGRSLSSFNTGMITDTIVADYTGRRERASVADRRHGLVWPDFVDKCGETQLFAYGST